MCHFLNILHFTALETNFTKNKKISAHCALSLPQQSLCRINRFLVLAGLNSVHYSDGPETCFFKFWSILNKVFLPFTFNFWFVWWFFKKTKVLTWFNLPLTKNAFLWLKNPYPSLLFAGYKGPFWVDFAHWAPAIP